MPTKGKPGKGQAKTKKQIRGEKSLKKISKNKEKFPEIAKKVIDSSDILLEIIDARFPEETRNLEAEEQIKKKNKKIIYLINKIDLISRETKDKIEFPKPYVLFSCKEYKGSQKARERIKEYSKNILKEKQLKKSGENKTVKENTTEKITVGVLGYPNTGKSSVINLLTGKKAAKTAAEAGLTKNIQKVKLTKNIFLFDTPGVISKEEYSSSISKKTSQQTKIGARSIGKTKDPELAIAEILKEFKTKILKHYNLEEYDFSDPEEFLETLGRKKSILKPGNKVDTDKTARLVLKEWQQGEIKI